MKHLLDPSTLKCRVCGTDWPRSPEGCPGAPPAAKPQLRVVPMHDRPPLTDVPARLRRLADGIETGVHPGDVAIVVLADHERRVCAMAYGNVGNRADQIGVLSMGLRVVQDALVEGSPAEHDDTPPKVPA